MTRTARRAPRASSPFASPAAAVVVTAILFSFVMAAHAKDKGDDAKSHKVSMKDLKYSPASLKIKAGETVLWVNDDTSDHTVVSDDPKREEFSSDNLGNGDTFSHTFKKAGKFPYHCKYHPRMKGSVTVTE